MSEWAVAAQENGLERVEKSDSFWEANIKLSAFPYVHYTVALGGPFASQRNNTNAVVFLSDNEKPFEKGTPLIVASGAAPTMWHVPEKGRLPVVVSYLGVRMDQKVDWPTARRRGLSLIQPLLL
jgi:hypothetical protein